MNVGHQLIPGSISYKGNVFVFSFFPKQKRWQIKIPDKADEGKEGDDEGPFVYGLDADCAEDDEAQLEGRLDGTDVTEGEIGFSHNNQLQFYSP